MNNESITNQTVNNQQAQTPTKGNKPVETLRDGALKVAILRNERENGTHFSMEPGRIYTDGQGHVRESKSLSGTEPIRMARLLDKSYDKIGEFKSQLKTQNRDTDRHR